MDLDRLLRKRLAEWCSIVDAAALSGDASREAEAVRQVDRLWGLLGFRRKTHRIAHAATSGPRTIK
jgi:hypothetical protein